MENVPDKAEDVVKLPKTGYKLQSKAEDVVELPTTGCELRSY
jgi:hypothetical protein